MTSAIRVQAAVGALLIVLAGGWSGCKRQAQPPAEPESTAPAITAPKTKHPSQSAAYTNWWLEWSRDTHVGSYQRVGRKDPKWDGPALQALEHYTHLRVYQRPPPGAEPDYLYRQLKQATEAGCDDPFVQYLYARLFARPPQTAKPDTASEYARWAEGVRGTGYPAMLCFYVSMRAAEAWRAAFTNQVPEVNRFRREAMGHLLRALRRDELPVTTAYEACLELYRVIEWNPKQRDDFYREAEPLWFARWPGEAFPYVLKGLWNYKSAWDARGPGWASTVTEQGWKSFRERMEMAEKALEKAWQLNPSVPETPVGMMQVELGQGRGRSRMETWYDRALAFPQDHYEAVQLKLWYLQPRWYGSESECLEAARAVVRSDRFRGQVPLHLYHTHESLAQYFGDGRPGYWTEPHVWRDIQACFERYFALNGDDTSWRHDYVMCAWRCRQWKALLEEAAKLKWVNYPYFGGEEAFEKMKQEARAKTEAGN